MTLGNWLWHLVPLAALGILLMPTLLAKKALGCGNAGRPALCVVWARRARAWTPRGRWRSKAEPPGAMR